MIESTTMEPRTEGPVARTIERQTSRIPSDVFLWAALGFLGFSAMKSASSRRDSGNSFLAQLAPTLLLLGIYNKLVKVAGSDKYDQERQFAGQYDA